MSGQLITLQSLIRLTLNHHYPGVRWYVERPLNPPWWVAMQIQCVEVKDGRGWYSVQPLTEHVVDELLRLASSLDRHDDFENLVKHFGRNMLDDIADVKRRETTGVPPAQ